MNVISVDQVVKSTCALHNWLNRSDPEHPGCLQVTAEAEGWTAGSNVERIVIPQSKQGRRAASEVRQRYAESFVTTHRVDWQEGMI